MSEQPILPYAGTSGWSGSSASEDRATHADADGTTAKRQRDTIGHLHIFASEGMTVTDLKETLGLHHGQASSVLSVLHKAGRVCRLRERRDRCHIYVLPEYVNGRETEPHGRRKAQRLTLGMVESIIKDAIYEARDSGQTIGVAANEAAKQIMQIVEGQ